MINANSRYIRPIGNSQWPGMELLLWQKDMTLGDKKIPGQQRPSIGMESCTETEMRHQSSGRGKGRGKESGIM